MIKTDTREIPANLLMIDPQVQRKLDPRRVDKIASAWDDLMVGVITVSKRANGDHVVLDGQTRMHAFRQVCGAGTVLPMTAQVHEGLTRQEEAEIFLKHNDRKAVNSRDRFRLAVVAGEEWAIDISAVLAKYDWSPRGVSVDGQQHRQFDGVVAAEKIYRAGGADALERTFTTIENAWGRANRDAVSAHMLYGLGQFHSRHPDLSSKNVHALVKKLSKIPSGQFIGEITADRRRFSKSLAVAAYAYVVDLYNKGRGEEHRLT